MSQSLCVIFCAHLRSFLISAAVTTAAVTSAPAVAASTQNTTNNSLAGGVSFLGGLALWLSSLEIARRANYEVFYKLHHIGKYVLLLLPLLA